MKDKLRYVPRHVSGNKKISNMKIKYFIPFVLLSVLFGFIIMLNMTPFRLLAFGLIWIIFYFGLMEFERELGFVFIKDRIAEVIPKEIIYEGKVLTEEERTSRFVRKDGGTSYEDEFTEEE